MTASFVLRPLHAALGALALAAAAMAPAAASAAPLAPVGATFAIDSPFDTPVATPVQYWGHHPHGPGWGWRRHHEWGPRPYYARPYYARPHYGPRCTVRYTRVWDEWRGGWVSRPVRRCW
jgi:hypothetical protein